MVKERGGELGERMSDEYVWIKWEEVFNKMKEEGE